MTPLARTLALAAALAASGCGPMHIRTPRVDGTAAALYLADYGGHSGLIFARETGELVEYGYGWWDWYALNHDRWYNVFPLFIVPGEGALARRTLPPAGNAELLRVRHGFEHVWEIRADRQRVDSLRDSLDAAFERRRDREVDNTETGMTCVPNERLYTLLFNCNSAVAEWLEAVGCEVRGQRLMAEFLIEPE
ncbi:MAG: hypothetical protein AMXMBFR47_30200 [Planctomycetota bacterium]